jgi:hypothetical protein
MFSVLTGLFAAPLRSPEDYFALIHRVISDSDPSVSRQAVYSQARSILAAQLKGRSPALSRLQRRAERVSLEKAIRGVERVFAEQEQALRRMQAQPTISLVIALMFPGLWAMDFCSMSLIWVARLPKR